MDRPRYKPARMDGYSKFDDDLSPLMVFGMVAGIFVVSVSLLAMWMLCII